MKLLMERMVQHEGETFFDADVPARIVAVADFVSQLCRKFGLECRGGINIRFLCENENKLYAGIEIPGLLKPAIECSLQRVSKEKPWRVSGLPGFAYHIIKLYFDEKTEPQSLPEGVKSHRSLLKVPCDETGNYKFQLLPVG